MTTKLLTATPKVRDSQGTIRISNSKVESICRPVKGQDLYYDDKLRGFGVRVTAGSKTYVAEARVRGRVCRCTIGKHGVFTSEQARKEAKRILGLMAQGVNPNEEKVQERCQVITLAELLDQYKKSKSLRPTTTSLYDGALRRCFSDWADKPITDITKDMVETRHKQISNRNGPRGKGEAHANQAMRILRSLFNYASSVFEDADGKSLLADNPVRRLSQVKAWNRPVRRQSYINRSDLPKWHKAVMGLPNATTRDFLLFVLFTGLRRTEAATLKWTDINIGAKTLTIPADRTKTHQEHKVPLCVYLMDMLLERAKTADGDYIFPGKEKNTPIAEPKRSVASVVANSGVKFMIHDLRRTCTTAAEGLDIPHYALKRLGNWSNHTDVTSGYIIQDVERMREPMEKISAFFQEAFKAKPEEPVEDAC